MSKILRVTASRADASLCRIDISGSLRSPVVTVYMTYRSFARISFGFATVAGIESISLSSVAAARIREAV